MRILIKKSTFFEYIIALAIILDCNSVWNNLVETRTWFQLAVMIMLLVGVTGFLFFGRGIPKNIFCVIILIILYYFLFVLLNGNSIIQTVLNIMLSCVLIGVYNMAKNQNGNVADLLVCFKNIMLFVAVISLIFWFAGSVFEIIQPTGTSLTNWTGNNNQTIMKSYFGVYYSYQRISFFNKLNIVRNIAIFNEAPMASLCFSLGLMVELLCCEKWKKRNCVVLVVAILSTFSTTGYIIATVVCVYKSIKSNSQYSVIRLIKRLCVPVMICVVLIIANSLIQEKLSTFSGMARTDDFVSGFRAWLLHPLFGDGIGSMRAMSLVRPSWRKEAEGFNSGLIQVLVQGGVYLAFPYFFVQLKSLRKSFKVRNYDKVVFELLFCFVFCITVIAFNYLTLMVLWFLALDSYSKKEV